MNKSFSHTAGKESPEMLLLRLIHSSQDITRSELAEISHFSPSLISKVVRQLIDEELVKESGSAPSTGGRPAVHLRVEPRARIAIGAEFSRHLSKVVVTDLHASLLKKYEAATTTADADMITATLVQLIEKALSEFGRERTIGLGVAVPGVANPEHGVMEFYDELNIHRYPIGEKIQTAVDFFPLVYNRVIAAAMGVKWQGGGRDAESLFYLSIGGGIGGGLILHGEPYLGSSLAIAEIGHVNVAPDGPLCFCGSRGCLQTIASSNGLVSRVKEQLKRGHESGLAEQIDGNLDLVDVSMLFEAARDNDVLAQQVLSEAANHVAIALGNVVNLLSPRCIVLGGPLIATYPEPWFDMIREAIPRHALAWPMHSISVVRDQLDGESRSIGAAALVIHHWLRRQTKPKQTEREYI